MIIVYTYQDEKDGKTYVDFGVDSRTDKFVLLPPKEFNVQEMGLVWSDDFERYCIP